MKILVNGCSISFGEGLEGNYRNKNHFFNVFLDQVCPGKKEITNISSVGQGNQKTFFSTVNSMLNDDFDMVLIGWTSYPRYEFFFDFGIWPDQGQIKISASQNDNSYHSDRVSVTNKNITLLQKQLLKTHDHYHIIDILNYCRILNQLHKKVYHINVIVPWSQDYFSEKSVDLPSDLDSYTQQLLGMDTRTDEEIRQCYKKMHEEYQRAVGDSATTFWSRWINLYQGIKHFQSDLGTDLSHPGPGTHLSFGDYLAKEFEKNNSNV